MGQAGEREDVGAFDVVLGPVRLVAPSGERQQPVFVRRQGQALTEQRADLALHLAGGPAGLGALGGI